jgi:hypothetical protein
VALGLAYLMLVRVGAEPDLFFDGRSCADQYAAHHAGFITAATLGLLGQRVVAALTPAGHEALDGYALAA